MPNAFEVSDIHAIRADAERFSEDDIVRLCDFTLEILGPCCTKPETCEKECIYRWKHRAAEAEKALADTVAACPQSAYGRCGLYRYAPADDNPYDLSTGNKGLRRGR